MAQTKTKYAIRPCGCHYSRLSGTFFMCSMHDAAPDLLEALQAITSCYGLGLSPEKFCEQVHDFMLEGRGLVAKAKGA